MSSNRLTNKKIAELYIYLSDEFRRSKRSLKLIKIEEKVAAPLIFSGVMYALFDALPKNPNLLNLSSQERQDIYYIAELAFKGHFGNYDVKLVSKPSFNAIAFDPKLFEDSALDWPAIIHARQVSDALEPTINYPSKKIAGSISDRLLTTAWDILLFFAKKLFDNYLSRHFFNSLERIFYNEGIGQALLTLTGMVTGGFMGSFLGMSLTAMPIIMLALAIGISNPLGWVYLGIALTAFIGASVGTFFVNSLHNKIKEVIYTQAIDCDDPHRFCLTKAEETNLKKAGFNLIAVICAMAELRCQLGSESLPAWPLRFLSSEHKPIQEKLNILRKLRQGQVEPELAITNIGKTVEFNLKPKRLEDWSAQIAPLWSAI